MTTPGTIDQQVSHPAKFSAPILETVRKLLDYYEVEGFIVDPFAGVGGIHDLATTNRRTYGIELEPEWAEQMMERGPGWCGDFFHWEPKFTVAAVVTSPTYANRMSDHHEAKDDSRRMTYKHQLGRDLTAGNSASMGWGVPYRAFHIMAWNRCRELLMAGGWMFLNVKDHVRNGQVVPVADWHRTRLIGAGFQLMDDVQVPVRGMGFGQNRDLRVDHERVMAFYRPRAKLGKAVVPRDPDEWT